MLHKIINGTIGHNEGCKELDCINIEQLQKLYNSVALTKALMVTFAHCLLLKIV